MIYVEGKIRNDKWERTSRSGSAVIGGKLSCATGLMVDGALS